MGHEACPAGGNERAGAGTGDAGRSVNATGPVGGDEILVGAEADGSVEEGRCSFGGKAVFVGIAADAGHPFKSEVKRRRGETCANEERNQK